MKYSHKIVIILVCFFCLSISFIDAQTTQEKFGKNRVQHKRFYWRYLSTINFDVYYYDNGSRLANFATRFLESEFNEITDILGYTPYFKTKIFIYNSISDLQQSNVGVDDYGVITGGQTNLFKSQVEIPFTGSEVEFKKELRKGIAQMLIREMMFGGSLKDMLQSSYLNKFSDWFLLGAAAYVAEGWSEEMDDHMRDMFRTKRVKKPNILSGKDAVLVGQSIWNYIAEKYGESNISSILNLARIIRNERLSVSNALNIRYNTFLDGWKNYYGGMEDEVKENSVVAEKDFKLRKKNKKGLVFNEFKFNPDGSKIAYSENKRGKYKVIVQNLKNRKKKTIYKGGYDAINQRYDDNIPLIAWRDNTNLGLMLVRKGETKLSIYNMRKKKSYERIWYYFNHVSGFDFSDDGNMLALSADKKGEVDFKTGQNDIYTFNLLENNLKQITDDWFDDIDPVFLPNSTNAIAFSSNRTSDSLSSALIKDRGNYNLTFDNFELYIYNPLKSVARLQRLTFSPSNDIEPRFLNEKQLLYLNDESGIYQLKKYDLSNDKDQTLTNYSQSIRTFDINVLENSLAYLTIQKGRLYPYYKKNFNLESDFPNSFATFRAKNLQKDISNETIPVKVPESFTDSSKFEKPEAVEVYESDEIDTDNYQFDTDVVKENKNSLEKAQDKMLEQVRKANQNEIKVRGPIDYKPRFRSENVVTTFNIDPLRGLGLLMNLTTSDLLENHKIKGGAFLLFNLRNSDFFGEYQYLARRFDITARFDRKVTFFSDFETNQFFTFVKYPVTANPGSSFTTQRFTLNRFETTISYPLTNLGRISITPFYTNTQWTELLTPNGVFTLYDQKIHYSGAKVQYVFDNTTLNGQNMISGTKIKIAYEKYETVGFSEGVKVELSEPLGLNKKDFNFDKITVDIRKYIPLHRDLIFATRLFYGRFGGNAPKDFMLGGMDNWAFNSLDNGGRYNPIKPFLSSINPNIPFNEFVTNLRGFNYNKMAGENVFLMNLELRLPIFKYLFGKRINSAFFQNFQMVGFYDFGAAWTGISPFNRENSLNIRNVGNPDTPFEAVVNDFKNPWLAGYGVGLRTVLLGYYVKLDAAWGVEDFIVSDPKFYLTFGYDF